MTTDATHSRVRTRVLLLAVLTAAAVVIGIILVTTHGSDPNRAAAVTPITANTVSVSGTGTVEGKPDTLVANFRVHVTEPSVQAALDASAADANKVINSLEKDGVANKDIRTTDVSLDPSYDRQGIVDGYDSGETLNVRIHPLTHVGQILTAAAGAAGNSVNLQGVSFDINDNSTLLAAARAEAFGNAKAAADQYATLGGTRLGRVMHITAVVHDASPIFRGYAAAGLAATDSAKSIPIQAGQKKVSVTVKVIWALA